MSESLSNPPKHGSGGQSPGASPVIDLENDPSFEGYEDVQAARAHIEMVSHKFGVVVARVRHFSNQLKKDTRESFPVDEAIYDELDGSERQARNLYLVMRVATFVTFAVFIYSSCTVFNHFFPPEDGAAGSVIGSPPLVSGLIGWAQSQFGQAGAFAGAAMGIAVVFTVFFGVREFIRLWMFNNIEISSERVHNNAKHEIDSLRNRITSACSKALLRQMPAYPQRAKLWTLVALWNGKRTEYLDRYTTAIAWRIERFVELTELVSAFFKICVFGLAGIIFLHSRDASTGFLYSELAVLSLLGWYVVRRKNDFWSGSHGRRNHKGETDGHHGGRAAAEHYFDTISDVVRAKTEELLARDLGRP